MIQRSVQPDTAQHPNDAATDRSADGVAGLRTIAITSELDRDIAWLRRLMEGHPRVFRVVEGGHAWDQVIIWSGYGPIKRAEGRFHVYEFKINDVWGTYEAIVKAQDDSSSHLPSFQSEGPLLLRIDSGCTSGQVLRDNTCECEQQLDIAIARLAEYQEGLIVRIPNQDGRGMGGSFKLSTLYLQDTFGLDTIEAAKRLSEDGRIDKRTYAGVISVLKYLAVPRSTPIHLATNNPLKERILGENAYLLDRSVAVHAPRTKENEKNLLAKKAIGHRF